MGSVREVGVRSTLDAGVTSSSKKGATCPPLPAEPKNANSFASHCNPRWFRTGRSGNPRPPSPVPVALEYVCAPAKSWFSPFRPARTETVPCSSSPDTWTSRRPLGTSPPGVPT
ncbi:hypothetical protein LX32DRAFT_637531 [Colletotrichum zoysiae]|uniref:Uncharacterized protein n=1 Tax=Colletotrichum zoysiae TaxID=1216348 RepID=A0AAD9HMJ6_9PEZI|nr:hypothetical protein LX32DRAFT_637531 [Colletotrichum zoysiae]